MRVLVTGGAGFLGRQLVRELHEEAAKRGLTDDLSVRVFDRAPYNGEAAADVVVGDITDREALLEACEAVDVVIHAAAMIDWGNTPPSLLHDVNVGGTRNVIDAALNAGVSFLVHTSTMDVLFDGTPLTDADESAPYADPPMDAYGRTKSQAERIALASDGRAHSRGEGFLRTAVIRPCGMYGERDPYHISSMLEAFEKGQMGARVGDGDARFEHVYVGNVAYAHALLAFAMWEGNDATFGQAYMATDQRAVNFFDFMAPFAEAFGYEMPSRRLPTRAALALAEVVEVGTALVRPFADVQVALTRASALILCHDITFVTDKAERHFGYTPRYSTSEAFERTVADFRAYGRVKR